MLRTPGLLQAPGSSNPKTPPMQDTAIFPELFGPQYNLHFGFILVIIATVVVWWILSRSSLGFKFRAVGENPHAARVAGINVKSMYIIGMLIAGALVGLAGVNQVLGTITTGFSADIDAGIGFDAITVALLGRSTPWGTFAAGILFGAFKAGGFAMQAAEGIPIEIVTSCRRSSCCSSPRRRWCARSSSCRRPSATSAGARRHARSSSRPRQEAVVEMTPPGPDARADVPTRRTLRATRQVRSWKAPIALAIFTVLLRSC